MHEDKLSDMAFTAAEFDQELSASEFMEVGQDPEIAYAAIRNRAAHIESISATDSGLPESKLRIRGRIEVFQLVMQYVEAFGIHLKHHLQDICEESLGYVDTLISTQAGELKKELFKEFHRKGLSNRTALLSPDIPMEETIRKAFGYNDVERIDTSDSDIYEDEVPEQDFEEMCDSSVRVIHRQLQKISKFYLDFGAHYNAVKHGDRVLTQPSIEYSIESESLEAGEVTLDAEEYATFLCKHHKTQSPYLASLPSEWLIEYSLSVASIVENLYTHLKSLREAAVGGGKPFEISFYKDRDSSEKAQWEWVSVENAGWVSVLPVRDKELQTLIREQKGQFGFAAGLSYDNGLATLETRLDQETSMDYPFWLRLREVGSSRPRPEKKLEADLELDRSSLTARDWQNLKEVRNDPDGPDTVVVEIHHDDDIEKMEGLPSEPIAFPEIELPLEENHMAKLCRLEKITERPIPLPRVFSKEHQRVLREEWPSADEDFTRADANEIVNRLRELSDNISMTSVVIEWVDSQGSTLREENIGMVEGSLDIPVDDLQYDTPGDQDMVSEYWGHPILQAQFPIWISDIQVEELVDRLQENPNYGFDIVTDTDFSGEEPEGDPDLEVLYGGKDRHFWFREYELKFRIQGEPS
jgi:hypothetical protein